MAASKKKGRNKPLALEPRSVMTPDPVIALRPQAKIMISFLSHDRVHAGFTYDYGHLIAHFISRAEAVPGQDIYPNLNLQWCMTSILPEGRQRLVEHARETGCTHILWLDSDMRFPRETIHMLLRHDADIVGCNYVARRPPFRFTAATVGDPPQMMVTRPDQMGLEPASHIGFGVLLTNIRVFEEDVPWFDFQWQRDAETGKWRITGEDVFCCRELLARGYKAFVDHELSAAIGHTGEFIFTAHEMAQIDAG